MQRRTLLRSGAAIAGASALGLATWAGVQRRAWAQSGLASAEPGAAPFLVHDLDWVDARRQRPVPVRLYLPRQASSAQPVPLVVFSHGIGGSRRGYSYLGSHWAGQGMASLHLQHVGSDRGLWSGNVFTLVSRLQDAATEAEALARVQDLRFALDQALSDRSLAPLLRADHVLAAGHSYGANTALLAAGAQVAREGQVVDLREPRLRGAILISAPPFYGEAALEPIVGPVRVPTVHITATEDVIRIPGYYSGAEDRVRLFEATGSTQKWLAVFQGGSHSMFTDRAGTGGALLNPQVKAATRELALAFAQQVFDGRSEALQRWPQQHAALLARFTPVVARQG
jgi:dienelactone hydrolase